MRNSKGEGEGRAVYEIGYLILPSIPEDKLADVVNSIREVVTREGGVEVDAEAPFKYPLSYAMSKTIGASNYVVNDAYLGWIKFDLESAKALVVKTGVEKIEEVLRFLMLKAPRETYFTFAKAMKAIEEKEVKEDTEEVAPSPVEEPVTS